MTNDMVNENKDTMVENPASAPMTPGQQLRQAREAKNLTQEAVAKKLFINKQFIIDIEENNYSKLTAPVYARGYLSAYARLLQLPPEPLLEEFSKLIENAKNRQSPMNILQEIEITNAKKDRQYNWLGYTGVIVVIIVLALWGYTHFQRINAEKILEKPAAVANTEITPSIPDVDTQDGKTTTTVISIPKPRDPQYTETSAEETP